MSRNAIVATLIGAFTLVLGAFSAQAAPMMKSTTGVHEGKPSLVQKAHYRRHHHHRHHHHHYR